ncbi:MAG: DUF1444 family protein [Verrucomicrobiales bacterium]|nr:DUF1444 family protein [Verrucomicrobiales bacterium]
MILSDTAKQMALSPNEFTGYYVASLKQASPTLEVEVVHELELKVSEEGSENQFQTFLDNAYAAYINDQEARDEIIDQFVASQIETFEMHKRPGIDPERIVPIVKDRSWMEAVLASMENNEAEFPTPIFEDYNSELQVFFAEDSEHNIRYLNKENIESLPFSDEELYDVACKNLKRMLEDNIEISGGDGIFMLTAGGNYETSLMLFNSLWRGNFLEVMGRTVISIPTRDLLLVTGSEDEEGIARIRHVAEQAMQDTPYTVSPVLFVWADGKFEVFEG